MTDTASLEDLRIPRVASDNKFPGLTVENEGTWKENFVFVQAADTQFGLIDNWAGNPSETRVWDDEIRLTKQAIENANKMEPKPKFFIVCGDLVDDGPGQVHQKAQQRDFKKVFEGLENEIPLVCVCGNHDVGNEPTPETLQEYRTKYGNDYFSFWISGVLFLVINSQLYYDHSNCPEEFEKQEKWLDEQLAITKAKGCTHCVMFQHIPWFINEPNEDDEYFNIPKTQRVRMLDKLKESGVKHVFCGHYHRNAGGFDNDLEVVITSAIGCQIGNDKSGMRLVRISEHKIDHKYYSLPDWPKLVDLSEKVELP